MKAYQLYIGGQFVENGGREMIPVINPATEEAFCAVPCADAADVDRAVSAAVAAQKEWARRSPADRADYLREIAGAVREHIQTLGETVTREQGKSWESGQGEAQFTAFIFDYIAEYALRYKGEILNSTDPDETIHLYKAPRGVIGAITPWNWPLGGAAQKIAPALLTGNAVVVKPSSETPVSTLELAAIIDRTSLPKGLLSVISGSGSKTGAYLSAHPNISMISMTGSVAAGAQIMKAAAPNITNLSLELGGKAPAIVMPDADLKLAASCIAHSRMGNSGQVCTCPERVYVHASVAEEFTNLVAQNMRACVMGDPLKDKTVAYGPLVSKKHLDAVDGFVQEALSQGAKRILGGKRADFEKGYFYEPTVLLGEHRMTIFHEEVFGPVLPIAVFHDFDEALQMANDCQYGLSSSIFTNDADIVMRASRELEFGEVYVNRGNGEGIQGYHAGWKRSGIGGGDGDHGLEEYLQTRVVYQKYDMHKK